MAGSEFPPSGCQHCGLQRHLHFQRWTDEAGWHRFTTPTKERIAERMRVRYANRLVTSKKPRETF